MTDPGGIVTVRAPGTSANLGPGFDAFGLCLGVADDVTATVTDGGLVVDVAGEGADDVPRDESHLVVRSMMATFRRIGVTAPAGLTLSCTNRLPHGRGLGSSAAAIVSGILLAEALSPGRSLSSAETIRLAAEIEGHPDNVAACLLGGLTIAWIDADGSHAVSLDVHDEV
ncbi:MAG: homoserine kinase, partial [Nocardioidaceae bacterium]